MEWKPLGHEGDNDANSYAVPKRWLRIHYYDALNILFRVENSLRLFVYVILKAHHLDKWADINIASEDGTDTTIAKQAKRRMHQAKSFGYLGYDITCPIMHLTAGELSHLIFKDPYWPIFGHYFLGDKAIMRTKLDEIGSIRNALAHFRPIKNDDVDVIKQNAKHALGAIEDCLHNFLNTRQVVPTNTSDSWYTTVTPVGGGPCSVRLFQSSDEDWICIQLSYDCPEISHRFSESFRYWTVLTLNSSALLHYSPILTKYVICLTETTSHSSVGKDEKKNTQFTKHARFVFSKSVLAQAADEIKGELERLVLKISEESDLVLQDHLARGILVRSGSVTGRLQGKEHKYWIHERQGLRTPLRKDDPPEYWGTFGYFGSDFIAGSNEYPWMASEISDDDDIPF